MRKTPEPNHKELRTQELKFWPNPDGIVRGNDAKVQEGICHTNWKDEQLASKNKSNYVQLDPHLNAYRSIR
jgi:hypothetical protein